MLKNVVVFEEKLVTWLEDELYVVPDISYLSGFLQHSAFNSNSGCEKKL
jgi:hypothetical protein